LSWSAILTATLARWHLAKMDMGVDSSSATLNDTGVNFSNETQAFNFLQEILDDSDFQVTGNAFARYFWYGIAVVIGIAALFNIIQVITLKMRPVL
jgi:ferric-chelate reductase